MQSMKYLPVRKQMRISRFVKLQVVILPILRTCKPFSPFWTHLLWIDRFYLDIGILVNAILLICMYQDTNHEITSCVVMAASETRLVLLCCEEG